MTNPICGYRICEFIPEAAQQALTSASQFMGRSWSYISNTPIVIPEFAQPAINTVSQFMGRSWSWIKQAPGSFQELLSNFSKYKNLQEVCRGNYEMIGGVYKYTNRNCNKRIIQGDHINDFINYMSNSITSLADSTGNIFHSAVDKTSNVLDRVMPEQVKNVAYSINAAIPYEAKIAALFCIAAFGIRHIYKSYHKKPEVKNDRFTIISNALKNAPQKITELFFVAKQQLLTAFGK